jgi:Ni/Fe-hydrogenase subunit HybB-like protein
MSRVFAGIFVATAVVAAIQWRYIQVLKRKKAAAEAEAVVIAEEARQKRIKTMKVTAAVSAVAALVIARWLSRKLSAIRIPKSDAPALG